MVGSGMADSPSDTMVIPTADEVQRMKLVNPLYVFYNLCVGIDANDFIFLRIAVFGVASGPSARLEAFRAPETTEKGEKATCGPGMKRVTDCHR